MLCCLQLHSVDLSKPDVAVFKSILNHKDLKDKSFELTMLVNNAGSIGHADQLAADMDDSEEWNRYLNQKEMYKYVCVTITIISFTFVTSNTVTIKVFQIK